MRERLTASELRNVEKGDWLVAKLHEDEYWMQNEGRVSHVAEYDDGTVHVVTTNRGYESRIKIPADARKGIRVSAPASGARNLRVTEVIRYA